MSLSCIYNIANYIVYFSEGLEFSGTDSVVIKSFVIKCPAEFSILHFGGALWASSESFAHLSVCSKSQKLWVIVGIAKNV